MNTYSSSSFIGNFGLGTGVVGGGGVNRTDIGVVKLIDRGYLSYLLLRNLLLSMFMERVVHPYISMGMAD